MRHNRHLQQSHTKEHLEKGADTETTLKLGQNKNQVRMEGAGPSECVTTRPGSGSAPLKSNWAQSRVHPCERRAGHQLRQGTALWAFCWPLLPSAGCGTSAQAGRKVRGKAALRLLFIPSPSPSPIDCPTPSLASSQGTTRASRWCRSLARDLVGTVQQSCVNVLGTGNLGFDDRQVLWVGQAVRLYCVWLGGCGHQRRRVLGTVAAL